MTKYIPAVGATIVSERNGVDYEIHRASRNSYTLTRRTYNDDLTITVEDFGAFRSFAAIMQRIDDLAFQASMIPSTTREILNVRYMAFHACSAQARKFWTLRLNRMFLAV